MVNYFSKKGINKLLSMDCYSHTVDDFYWSIIGNQKYKKPPCIDNKITLETYIASEDM